MAEDAKTTEERRKDETASVDNRHLLEELREDVHNDLDIYTPTFEAGKEDADFLAGDDWEERARRERENDDLPCLSFPKLAQFLDLVVGDEQQQTPGITVRAADGVAKTAMVTNEKGRKIKLADAYAGMIRNIERNSTAEIAYDTAFEGSAGWGWGHWRILTYWPHDSFDREIKIAPIVDPYAVVWDGNAVEYTREDARRCLVRSAVSRKEYERLYPGMTVEGWDVDLPFTADWTLGDTLYVAEWFRKVDVTYTLLLMSDGSVMRKDENFDKARAYLAAQGVTVVREREHDGHKIEWRLVSGGDILEGPVEWTGHYIPVVPLWGRCMWRDNRPIYRGLIRTAKDEQRTLNYARTIQIEAIASIPKAPWVGYGEVFAGYEEKWETANTERWAYLPAKRITAEDGSTLPLPTRQFGGVDINAINALVQTSEQGIKSAVGVYDPTLGNRSQETSGRAIVARQQQGDKVTFPYVENLRRSVQYTGRILVDLIPRVYDNDRVVPIVNDDNTEDTIRINYTVTTEDGKNVRVNDLSVGRFDVACDMGQSYSTRRLEAVDSMMQIVEKIPPAGPILADMIVANTDTPGAQAAAERLRKGLVPPEVIENPEDDMSDWPPEAQAALQSAQQQMEMMGAQMEELAKAGQENDSLKADIERLRVDLAREKAKDEVERKQMALDYDRRVYDLQKRVDAATADAKAALAAAIPPAVAETIPPETASTPASP